MKQRAFTLIEILVVVLVVGILARMVVLSFSDRDKEQALQGYAERLALRIEAARDRALQHNKEWGLYIDTDGVRFAEYDELTASWVEQGQRPFSHDPFSETIDFDVDVEAFDGSLLSSDEDGNDTSDTNPLPRIVLFSSGETTPFTIAITPREWETLAWELNSDGFSRTQTIRAEL